MKHQLALAAFAVLSVSAPAPAQERLLDNLRIIGGIAVVPKEPIARMTAALLSSDGGLCTVSVVSGKIVVTAAHCAQGQPEDYLLVFGTDVDDPLAPTRKVVGVAYHPGFDQVSEGQEADWHDIAVMRFEGGLPQDYVPAALLSSDSLLKKNGVATLAGYGITQPAPSVPSGSAGGAGRLRKVSVKITRALGKSEVLVDQASGNGACHGDSGGPAYIRVNGKLTLFGTTSRRHPADGPDDCKAETVYTSINANRVWLNQAVKELLSN